MELRHLRYFIAVVEEGTVTGAATRLFITQPALSRQLRDLERHVGAPLLVRSSRGVSPTPEGERLLPLARQLVQRATALVTMFDTPSGPIGERRTSRLVVGLHDGALGPLNGPVQMAHQGAFAAVPATGAARRVPGVAFVRLLDAPPLPTGVAVARRAHEPGPVAAFRQLARATAIDLIALLPDARPPAHG